MVYMSRMPVGGKEGQSRLGKRTEDGPKRNEGTDGSTDTSQGLEAERESNKRLLFQTILGGIDTSITTSIWRVNWLYRTKNYLAA